MRNVEDIVVSLGVAKKLKSHGFRQEAIWFWTVDNEHDPFLYAAKRDGSQPTLTPPDSDREYFAALTAEEILSELQEERPPACQENIFQGWIVGSSNLQRSDPWKPQNSDTLANAAASMWIYLNPLTYD